MGSTTTGPGAVLDLIRRGVTTRRGLLEELGWSRVTLARRLDELRAAGVVVTAGSLDSGGGRPPEELAIDAGAGVILAIDIGGSHSRVGVTDLVSDVLCEDEADIGIAAGPDEVFSWAFQVFEFLLARVGRTTADVRGIGIGVPGPVDARTGRLGAPQIDERWEGVVVADFARAAGVSAVVAADRDVNILALGEARLGWPEYRDLVVVKVGMGVGCAFLLDGRVYRGSRGGAGELSAPRRGRLTDPLQRLEDVAGGAVIRRELAARGITVRTSADIVALARRGDPDVSELLLATGEQLGAELANVVGLLNPEALIIGGNLADAGERFLGAIRSGVLGTTHPYQRRGLVVERSRLGDKAGVRGASLLAQEAVFRPDRIDDLVRRGRSLRDPDALAQT